MSTGVGKVVCVTGASGYVASWLVKILLQRGYTINATVRNLNDPDKVAHLVALEGAKERLHLFEANLTEEGSFDTAVDGCECVFHTASPVIFSAPDPQAQIIKPAVEGTLNVLRSCRKVQTIKRVVLTSTTAALSFVRDPPGPDVIIDETWFSDPVVCEDNKLWYPLSKILAEKAAWKFAEQNGIDLVVMNPGFVIGPLLQPTLNSTSEAMLKLVKEGKAVWQSCRLIDVRDVVLAHILAFENPSANGRYCLVNTVIPAAEVLKILQNLYPAINHLAVDEEDNPNNPLSNQVSKEKATSLGISFTPLEVSLKDMVESLKEKKFLNI